MLVRYRDPESSSYLYFWTERREGVDVHVSPMFDDEQSAADWLDTINGAVRDICEKMKGEQ